MDPNKTLIPSSFPPQDNFPPQFTQPSSFLSKDGFPTQFTMPAEDMATAADVKDAPVDLNGFLNGNEEATRLAADQIRAACLKYGFFQVVNHGIDPALIDSVQQQMDAFFDLPLAQKLSAVKIAGDEVGYSGADTSKLPWKETFSLTYNFANGGMANLVKSLFGPDYEEAGLIYEKYCEAMKGLSMAIFELLAISLGLDRNHFVEIFKNEDAMMRSNHYLGTGSLTLGTWYDREQDGGRVRSESEIMAMYESWLVRYGKAYNAIGEKERRFKIFKDNLRFVDKHNSINSSWRSGINQFAAGEYGGGGFQSPSDRDGEELPEEDQGQCVLSEQELAYCDDSDTEHDYDPTALTILHQDQAGELEIFFEGKWRVVQPCSGAFVISIGNMFKFLSKEIYKSCLHRAVVNDARARRSLQAFFVSRAIFK